MMRISLVIPVHNDWPLVQTLLADIDAVRFHEATECSVLIVDDASTDIPQWHPPTAAYRQIAAVEALYLAANRGHQRAIALGLAEIGARGGFDAVVVMDADGEDRPSDLAALAAAFAKAPRCAVVAQRARRSESALFRACYGIYQGVFALLTGRAVDFGNFCLLGPDHLRRLLAMPDLWNHLAAALLRSGLPVARVPTARGRRYQGRSHFQFTGLLVHGLHGLSVFAEAVLARLALAGALGAAAALAATAADIVTGAEPTLPALASLALLQVAVTALVGALVVMNRRSLRPGESPTDCAWETAVRRDKLQISTGDQSH